MFWKKLSIIALALVLAPISQSASAAELSPKLKEVARQAIVCSQQSNYACTVKNYRALLDSNVLNSEQTMSIRSVQITSVLLLISEVNEQDGAWPAQKITDYSEYGIRLLKEAGREKGQQATIFYARGMIGHHELGNFRRKKELLKMARTAIRAHNQWDKIDDGVSDEDARVTIQWVNQVINALE